MLEQDVMDKFDELRNNFSIDQLKELEAAIDFYYETITEDPVIDDITNELLFEIDSLMDSYL